MPVAYYFMWYTAYLEPGSIGEAVLPDALIIVHDEGAYRFLDLVPKGSYEDGFDFSKAWARRHDQS